MEEETVDQVVKRLSHSILGNFAMEGIKIPRDWVIETEKLMRAAVIKQRRENDGQH